MAKVITPEALAEAIAKAVTKAEAAATKAVKAETKRCVAAVKSVELVEGQKPKAILAAAVAAINTVSAE